MINFAHAQEMAQEVANQVPAEQTNVIVKAFIDGGPTMYFIALVGILTVFIIIERFVSLQKLIVDKEDFMQKILDMVMRGDLRGAISFCDSRPAPLTNTLKAGLLQVANKRPDEEVQVAMDGASLKEQPRLEGWTPFLAVLGNVATLVGLLGTIMGLIKSFSGVAAEDPAKKAEILSQGISAALNCTAFGLLIAIPAIVFFGYFQLRTGRATTELTEGSMNLMNVVVSNREKMKY